MNDINLKNAAEDFFNYSHETIYTTDLDGFILATNDRLTELSGYSKEELVGQHIRIMKSGIHDVYFYKDLWKTIKETGKWCGELSNRKKDGSIYTIITTISTVYENNKPVRYLSVGTDISNVIELRELYASYAHYDILTGLPNRRFLLENLHSILESSNRTNQSIAVLFLDLDGFKKINDNYGHDVGDSYLISLSKILKSSIRQSDFIARLGGDEFIIILTNLYSKDEISIPLDKIITECKTPISIDNILMNTTCSIGVSFYPSETHNVDAETLIKQADQSMYIAKSKGKNQYHIYDHYSDIDIFTRDEIVAEVKESLKFNHFVLHYQPKVNLRDGSLYGVEALIRWNHPSRGMLYPDSFLPQIRSSTLSSKMDDYVIDAALKQYNDWLKCGFDIPISINIEPKYLTQYDFYDKIESSIKKYDIPYGKISFEILETSMLDLSSDIVENMNRCNDFGVTFEIDDFGVGCSSISNVLNPIISGIKIDKSFIQQIQNHNYTSIKHIVDFAIKLDKKCVAEGVETIDQGIMLLNMGCAVAQGYFISKPIDSETLKIWYRNWTIPEEWVNYE